MKEYTRCTIFAGQYAVATVPTLFTTILGSCISVCLWDRGQKLGGMNHYLLPGTPEDEAGNTTRGITSIPLLINSLANRRAVIGRLEAKVFGGCNSLYRDSNLFNIGERNAEAAFRILKEYKIPVTAYDIGGSVGRKIVFNTVTGSVRVRFLDETVAALNEKINRGFND